MTEIPDEIRESLERLDVLAGRGVLIVSATLAALAYVLAGVAVW